MVVLILLGGGNGMVVLGLLLYGGPSPPPPIPHNLLFKKAKPQLEVQWTHKNILSLWLAVAAVSGFLVVVFPMSVGIKPGVLGSVIVYGNDLV